jgi:TM2 domain-containing membrane protein YozV
MASTSGIDNPGRSPVIAGLLSGLLWPGAGQFYNKQHRKGLALACAAFALTGYFLWRLIPLVLLSFPAGLPDTARWIEGLAMRQRLLRDPFYLQSLLWPLYVLAAVWLYGIIDAVVAARRAAARSFQSHRG